MSPPKEDTHMQKTRRGILAAIAGSPFAFLVPTKVRAEAGLLPAINIPVRCAGWTTRPCSHITYIRVMIDPEGGALPSGFRLPSVLCDYCREMVEHQKRLGIPDHLTG